MKTNFKLLVISLLFATGCAPSYMASTAYEDDIYYSPGDAPLVVQEVSELVEAPAKPAAEPVAYASAATAPSTDTKTEPTYSSPLFESQDFTPFQERYADLLANDSIQNVDTLVYEAEEGYYLNEFIGDESDLEDAARLRAWYPQGFGYIYGNGYTTAMMLAGDSDWNVYVQGNYVWWTPTWTNVYFYNDYRFNPQRYGRLFAYGMNYGTYAYSYSYPSVSIGWGIGRYPYWDLYFDWYYPGYYGYGYWGYPYYGHYYYGYPYYGYGYYGHHHHHGHHGHYATAKNHFYGSRSSISANSMYNRNRSGGNYTRRSATGYTNRSAYSNRSSVGTRTGTAATRTYTNRSSQQKVGSSDARRSQAATRYSTRNSRYSTSNRTGVTNRSSYIRRSESGTNVRSTNGSQYNRGTRSSYSTGTRRTGVPSYSKPRTNTRPSYNRTGTSSRSSGNYNRSYTRPNNSYKSTRSSGYSKVRSGATYQRGSSKSSGSSYKSGGSNYRSNSSGSRSSGSSYRSSGSSSSRSSYSGSSGSSRSSSGTSRSSGSRSRSRR